MKLSKAKALVLAVAFAGMPLVTVGTCDPATGAFEFFRDDDNEFYHGDGNYYHDGFYEEEVVYYEEGYYEDCVYCW